MGVMIDGKWTEGRLPEETGRDGAFLRAQSAFRDAITADGSSEFPAQAGRYHLYVMPGCPWAHRTMIYRAVKGLEDAISIDYALPHVREEGWTFGTDPKFPMCTEDRLNGFRHLHQLYASVDPHYTGKVTVPVLYDKKTRRIVNNESSEIIRMLNAAFVGVAGNDTDYYPAELRGEIDALNAKIYHNVNNGVYRCGFAQSQEAYEEAYDGLFATLDELEALLATRRYLCGARITEADWRLLPTLVRFDCAYFTLFRCNRQRMADFHNLSNYMRDLCAQPGVAATLDARIYTANYWSIERLNPTGLIPKGTPVDYASPHDRARLG